MKKKFSKINYQVLFDEIPLGLAYCQMVYDSKLQPIDYIFIEVNKNFEKLTGMRNVVKKKVSALIPGIRETNSELFTVYDRVASTGKSESLETYIGVLRRWFIISAYSPKKGFFIAIFQNISEQKQIMKDLEDAKIAARNVLDDLQSEKDALIKAERKIQVIAKDLEKFKLAVDNISDNILITDLHGIVLYANRGVETTTGYTSEETVGKKSGSLWKAPMPSEYYKEMWDTIKNKKQIFKKEIQNRRKNGQLYTAVISIFPILDTKGDVEFFVGVERDITREKEIDRAKTEFVSLASHQLKTPLTTISWFSEMLHEGHAGAMTEKQAGYVEKIFRNNRRMVDLVNALLNVSRLEIGTLVSVPQPITVSTVADTALEDLVRQVKDKKLRIEKQYEPDLPKLNADPQIIQIIFQNLLSNAVKYTGEGGLVTVSISRSGPDILIKVADTGYGIPAAQQGQIFTKLFRADNVRAKDTDGTGLGLYIVKAVVERSGGKVWFKSVENQGTTFFVTLPLAGIKEGVEESKGKSTHLIV